MDTQGRTASRNLIIEDIVARTGIGEAMIERLVRAFYGRARLDPFIGPIFESKVSDWEAHIARICAFWSSVALMSGRYHGQPMPKHTPLPIEAAHFDRWLALFEAAARRLCPRAAADALVERAGSIGESLELAMAAERGQLLAPGERLKPANTASG